MEWKQRLQRYIQSHYVQADESASTQDDCFTSPCLVYESVDAELVTETKPSITRALLSHRRDAAAPPPPATLHSNTSYHMRKRMVAPGSKLSIKQSPSFFDVLPRIPKPVLKPSKKKRQLSDVVRQVDESFSEAVLRMIDVRGEKDSDVYKRAGLDRKLFSKIRCDRKYQPSKQTAIAFAIALRLNPDETRDLLLKAGYALSTSRLADVIVSFYIEEGVYDLSVINEGLYEHNEPLLGA